MTRILFFKLLRDVRVGLIVVMLLLFLFQLLWAKVTQRVADELLDAFAQFNLTEERLKLIVFKGPGEIVQTLMGGETISFHRAMDMMSVAFVHPLTQVILCVWAIGRAAGALAGEIDRGTMELLLAQPIRRGQVVFAHLLVDGVAIALLCLAMWAGSACGAWANGLIDPIKPNMRVEPMRIAPALLAVSALMFAVSGVTMAISSAGRSRNRVLGVAVLVMLLQFLLNLIGQLWPPLAPYRPFTVFYYYHPQEMILDPLWYDKPLIWGRLGVLTLVGMIGYVFAWWRFSTRDVPAPL